jgi:hypothetical protein
MFMLFFLNMVFIEDKGVFDAPIDKVWNLAQAHFTD